MRLLPLFLFFIKVTIQMSNATVSRVGQINTAGDALALFLKQFSGETLVAFEQATVALPRSTVRTIQNGKSAQFPAFGRTVAAYHTPGAEIVGKQIAQAEQVISIDGLLISDVFIANIDEAMSHYDVRSVYSGECGAALGMQMDKNILQVGLQAARAAAPVTGMPGGGSATDAAFKTDSSKLAAGLFAAAQNFDEKSVPEAGRNCFLKPAQYYLLAQNTNAINTLFGGQGAYADGTIVRIAGVELVKSLNLPTTNVVDPLGKYSVDGTNTAALVMHQTAVGTVKLLDLATESAYDIRRQGTLIVAKYAVGHGILRPEAAFELKTL